MKKILFVLFIGLITKSHAQTDYTFVYNNDSIIKKGIELYDAKQYQESINEFDRISKIDPKFLNVQYEKALSLSVLEKKEELKALFEELYSKKLMPEFPTLYTLYGSFLSEQKEFDQSEVIFKEGEKYLANSSNHLYNFAILYIRKDENQKAVDLLERIITNDPNHASSHYMLGAIAYDNGKVTEATLAMMSYLIIAPNGIFAKKAIQNLNAKYGENFTYKNKLVFSKAGDNFEDIDLILKNQLPLKKVYKVNSEIDDVIIRQIQAVAEYTLEHKIGDGFFETTYIPWIKDMMEKKRFESYTYYILQSLEGNIGKIINSQKKKIIDFNDNYVNGDLWNTYATRNLDLFGTPQKVVVSIKNHVPYLIGPVINGKSEGRYKYLNEDGNLAGDLNFKNNELDGIQKYFDKKGALSEEKSFKNGKLDGIRTTYYTNGNISLVENYKDDVKGTSTSYAVNGGKECEVNFVDGKRDGKMICLFSNGSVNSETNYSKGKLEGSYTRYNSLNTIVESYNYENDLYEGKQLEYYDSKTLKSEVTYAKGKVLGSYKSYYTNGTLEKENSFEDGKIKKAITYFQNEKKSSESTYNNKEELELYSYYDPEENKYFEENYKSGELKSGLQFSRKNPNPVAVSLSSTPFVMKDFDGNELASGDFEKDKKMGEWNHYYSSGIKSIQETFISGKLNSISKDYEKNGMIRGIKNYKDNELNGLYEVYENGILDRNYCYENGKQLGPHQSFYSDGSLKSEGYLVNGENNFNKIDYWQNGSIFKKNTYIDDVLSAVKTYNAKGEKENSFDYKNKTGKFTFKYNNGTTFVTSDFINGQLNGQLIEKDKFDNIIASSEFINGKRWNSYKDYSPLGTLYRESTFYNGSLNGIDKVYDIVGNLRYTTNNTFGVENGMAIRYYHNKSKMHESPLLDGEIEGESTYYNQKDEPILKIGYLNNHIKYYIAKSKTGEWAEKTEVKNETATIVSFYPNGKTAIQINFIKGNLEGTLLINNELGKPDYNVNYLNNNLNGNRIEYYANGNIYKKEKFLNNDFDGLQEYFKEDGKTWLTAEYKKDELHGNVLIYTNGKISITKKYDSNELVEIIK